MYTVDYFIEKFEKIPEKKWTTGTYTRGFLWNKRHCALGHCEDDYCSVGQDRYMLRLLFLRYLNMDVITVNDFVFEFGPTPKQRIINALYEIKRRIAKEEKETTRTTKVEFVEPVTVEIKQGVSV